MNLNKFNVIFTIDLENEHETRIFNRGAFVLNMNIFAVSLEMYEKKANRIDECECVRFVIGAVSQGAAAKQEAETGRIEMKNDEIKAYIERKWLNQKKPNITKHILSRATADCHMKTHQYAISIFYFLSNCLVPAISNAYS